MKFKTALLCAAAAAAVAASPALQAKTFRWASAGEISTWDIHSQNNALQNGIHAAVYESLVYYNSQHLQARARAGHLLDPGDADAAAGEPAPGRQVPRRHARSRPTTRCTRCSAP